MPTIKLNPLHKSNDNQSHPEDANVPNSLYVNTNEFQDIFPLTIYSDEVDPSNPDSMKPSVGSSRMRRKASGTASVDSNGSHGNRLLSEVQKQYKVIASQTEPHCKEENGSLPKVLKSLAQMRHCDLARIQSATEMWRQEMRQCTAENEGLQKELEQALDQKAAVERQLAASLGDNAQLQAKLQQSVRDSRETDVELRRARDDDAEKANQITSLKDQLAATIDAERRVREYSQNISDQHDQCKVENDKLTQKVRALEQQNESLTLDVNEAKKSAASWEEERKRIYVEIRKLKEDLARKKDNLTKYLLVIRKGVMERQKLNHQLEVTSAAEKRGIAAQKRMEQETKKLIDRNQELQNALKQKVEALETITRQKEGVDQLLSEERAKHKRHDYETKTEVKRIGSHLAAKSDKLEALKAERAVLLADKKALQKKESLWEQQMQVLQDEIIDQERRMVLLQQGRPDADKQDEHRKVFEEDRARESRTARSSLTISQEQRDLKLVEESLAEAEDQGDFNIYS